MNIGKIGCGLGADFRNGINAQFAVWVAVLGAMCLNGSSMDEETAAEIQKLRNQVGNLQMVHLATLAEVKSLAALSTALWEEQKVELTGGHTISEVLRLLKEDIVNDELAALADSDMNLASKLRRRVDEFLKNPPNPKT